MVGDNVGKKGGTDKNCAKKSIFCRGVCRGVRCRGVIRTPHVC